MLRQLVAQIFKQSMAIRLQGSWNSAMHILRIGSCCLGTPIPFVQMNRCIGSLSVHSGSASNVLRKMQPSLVDGKILGQVPVTAVQCCRWKSSKGKRGKQVEESSDEEDELEEAEEALTDDEGLEKGKDFKDVRVITKSLRLDAVLRAGLAIPRKKIEEAFYESRIRVNGKKALKKHAQVEQGDELDIVLGPSGQNDQMLEVSRVVVHACRERTENHNHILRLRRFKKLLIYNYDKEDWKDK